MLFLRIVLGIAVTEAGALPALAFYERYWRWRDCFNELGRSFDPVTQDVYLAQSGAYMAALQHFSSSFA